jgi:hypothetical protein
MNEATTTTGGRATAASGVGSTGPGYTPVRTLVGQLALRGKARRQRVAHQLATVGLALAVVGLVVSGRPQPVVANESTEVVTLAVVVRVDSKVENIGKTLLKRAYLSERPTGPDGRQLIPLNHPPRTPDRVGFDKTVLGMTADQVGRFWIDRRIRGGARPPRVVDNVTTLRRLVSHLPGTLAYLRPNQLDDSVKVLAVDGKKPGHNKYPLVYRK